MIARVIVSPGLNYCNLVFAKMSKANFNNFERVHYALARSVTGMPAYSRDHMTPVLAKLHWPPIRARVSFKIAMTVFQRSARQSSHPTGRN